MTTFMRTRCIFLVLLFCTILPNTTHADARRAVRVGIYETRPLAYTDTDGSAHGFFVDMLNHAAEKEQWDVRYVPGSWQEGLDRLKSDKIDLVLCIGYTEERDKYLDFPKEFLLLDWGLIFKPKGSNITSLLDLEGKSVSALKGDVYLTGFRELVRQFNVNVRIQEVDQYPDVFKAVESGAVAAGVNGNLYGMLNETGRGVEQTPIIFTPVKLGYAVNEGRNGDLIAALDRNIAEIKADRASIYYNKLEQLLGKKHQEIPKEAFWVFSGIAAALFIAITFVLILRREVNRKTRSILDSADQYQVMLQSTSDGFWRVNREGKLLDVNDRYAELSGYSRDELLGMNIKQLEAHETADEVQQHINAIVEAGFERFKSRHKQKNGIIWDVEVSASSIPASKELVTFLRDMTEHNMAEQALLDKNDELERFTYTVSHDLKSPLITIQSYVGMIKQDMEKGNHVRARDDLKRIENAAGKMTALLYDLLELSRIGRLMNQPSQVDMDRLVKDTLMQLAGSVAAGEVEVVVQPDLPSVHGDQKRIAEVMQNLIENAVKYMGDQAAPSIEIGARQDGNESIFFVSDNGKGIDPLHHDRIFGLFNKLDANSEGTGVGLALVKRIIEVHGGRVWVESEGEGMGSTFCFTLPAV